MSPIIKSGRISTHDAGGGVQRVAFNFNDMTDRANSYLDKVRSEAAQILADAKSQAQAIRKTAETNGRQAALQAVERVMEDKVARHMQTLLPALEQAVRQIEQDRQAWLVHWREAAVHVAAQIAARVIRREIAKEPQITLDLITEALQLAAGRDEVVLYMNSTDLENLGGQVQQIIARLGQLGVAQVAADAEITAGGCKVETRFGAIDQQIESQLKRIEEELQA
jgi:flagellar assembly protein FliH